MGLIERLAENGVPLPGGLRRETVVTPDILERLTVTQENIAFMGPDGKTAVNVFPVRNAVGFEEEEGWVVDIVRYMEGGSQVDTVAIDSAGKVYKGSREALKVLASVMMEGGEQGGLPEEVERLIIEIESATDEFSKVGNKLKFTHGLAGGVPQRGIRELREKGYRLETSIKRLISLRDQFPAVIDSVLVGFLRNYKGSEKEPPFVIATLGVTGLVPYIFLPNEPFKGRVERANEVKSRFPLFWGEVKYGLLASALTGLKIREDDELRVNIRREEIVITAKNILSILRAVGEDMPILNKLPRTLFHPEVIRLEIERLNRENKEKTAKKISGYVGLACLAAIFLLSEKIGVIENIPPLVWYSALGTGVFGLIEFIKHQTHRLNVLMSEREEWEEALYNLGERGYYSELIVISTVMRLALSRGGEDGFLD